MSIYRIPVQQDYVRTFKDPNGDHNRRTIYALVRLANLPEFPLSPDPRMPKVGKVYKTIQESAKLNDGKFHSKNRGITLCVRAAEFDNRTGELSLDIPDGEEEGTYGIIDGGHTHAAIHAAVQEAYQLKISEENAYHEQYVRLEIMVGIDEDLAEIAQARNFSVNLKGWGLEAYKGKFDWLLSAVGDFAHFLRIQENAEQPVPIMDIVQVLAALNPCLYPGDKPAVEAYRNAGKCLDAFVSDGDVWHFESFKPIARDIFTLYDYVRYQWDDKYNAKDENGQRGRIERRAENEKRQRGRNKLLEFYFLNTSLFPEQPKTKQGFPVEKGLAIPLMSAFRVLIREKPHGFEWIEDPFVFFDKHGTALVRAVMQASAEASGDAHRVGRDRNVYEKLYHVAENAYNVAANSLLQMEVERLRKVVRETNNG